MALDESQVIVDELAEANKAKWELLRRHVGRFRLHRNLLEMGYLEDIFKLFGQVAVLRCEYLYSQECFDYVALSPLFEYCPPESMPPEYVFTFEDGLIGAKKV